MKRKNGHLQCSYSNCDAIQNISYWLGKNKNKLFNSHNAKYLEPTSKLILML